MSKAGKKTIYLDSFSGDAADLKKDQRTSENVLIVLLDSPRISTWDMSDHPWLVRAVKDLEKRGLITACDEPYPWHKYTVTKQGLSSIK